jgi:hypothetical protein
MGYIYKYFFKSARGLVFLTMLLNIALAILHSELTGIGESATYVSLFATLISYLALFHFAYELDLSKELDNE